MQFIRNSLSFSFNSNRGNGQSPDANGTSNGASTNVRSTDDEKVAPARSESILSDRSQYATVRSRIAPDLGSPPSAYSTPFQSPVIASRAFPTVAAAASKLNGSDRDDSGNGTTSKHDRSSKVYFIEPGQLQAEYELPERPGTRRGRSVDNGITNPAFTNDTGATVINMSSTQPSVIREQYWTWSCRCHRELTSREKAMIIVIFVLVLVIGGLATYLGIVVDSDDGITGGILTRGLTLQPAVHH